MAESLWRMELARSDRLQGFTYDEELARPDALERGIPNFQSGAAGSGVGDLEGSVGKAEEAEGGGRGGHAGKGVRLRCHVKDLMRWIK